MTSIIQESKNTLNVSLNGSQKTKSNSTSSDVSTNGLLMSTSVPIKIGTECIQHCKDSIKSTKRIRYTFGLRKSNKLSSEQSIKRNEQVDSNYKDKSMESLYLNSSLTTEYGFSNVEENRTESLPVTCHNNDHDMNRAQIQFDQSKSQNKRLVKQTTIDYYV